MDQHHVEAFRSLSSIGRVPMSSPIALGVIKGLRRSLGVEGNSEALGRADPGDINVRELGVPMFQTCQ